MPKPSESATWATDGGTRVEPSSGEKAAGFGPGNRSPARKANWIVGVVAEWAAWLEELFDEDGEHAFPSPPLRSIVVSPRGNLFEGEWSYDLDVGETDAWAAFSEIDGGRWGMWLENVLPNGATIQSISALVRPGAGRAGSDRMSLAWYAQSEQYTGTEAVSLAGPSDTDFDDGGTGLQLLTMVISPQVTTDTGVFAGQTVGVRRFVLLSGGNDGGVHVEDAFFGFVIVFNDAPGLTNR